MPSYQDIETRLVSVEERLAFLMRTMKGRVLTPTGLLGVDGRPTATAKEVTLEDVFLMSKAQDAAVQNVSQDAYSPTPVQEKVNG